MNIEFCERWVDALRSGEYEQGTDALRTAENTFCCLGVACDLLVKDGVLSPWTRDYDDWTVEGVSEALPQDAQKFIGSTTAWGKFDDLPIYVDGNYHYDLATANDTGETFGQIANYIEAQIRKHRGSNEITG